MGEVPLLQELEGRFAERAVFVGVSLDEEAAALDRMVAEKEITWPQLWDGKGSEGEVPRLYAVQGTPVLYVIDAEGRIATRLVSAEGLEERLSAVVADEPVEDFSGARDRWQRPAEVMDALRIRAGSVVADAGSGDGYFSFHLARRVGRAGKVYAVDVNDEGLARLKAAAEEMRLGNIETIRGQVDDPKLPEGKLDAVLVVNAYHEFTEYDAMLRGFYRALRPGGLLGIVEWHAELGRERKQYEERHELPGEMVIEEAVRNGFRMHSYQPDFARPPEGDKNYYFVVLRKPGRQPLMESPGLEQ